MFEWDEDKAAANLAKHGVAFEAVSDFDFATAIETLDDRFDYRESRWVAIGFIGTDLHVLVYTPRGTDVRVISLRRANARERKAYEQAKA
ncbi:BrnT family toxin [Mycobacterium sp. KBS0706]|uniref:BrnT family toxin n=1 Tax=Mycobacterium sp. KBS0706 TaxID=2578109 RepID=UPI00110F812C|nr:BrnT family toxin [Mycobacterium sp. KBS0706]TSD89083.1 BrnT family toxin [Mycobacterium sp. KBS0706]